MVDDPTFDKPTSADIKYFEVIAVGISRWSMQLMLDGWICMHNSACLSACSYISNTVEWIATVDHQTVLQKPHT